MVGFVLEHFAAHHRRSVFRCDGDGVGVFAGAYGVVGVFHRRHACRAHARHAQHFAGGHLQKAVYHHAVAGHGLVGVGRGARQAGDVFGLDALCEQPTDCLGGKFGIGVRGAAAVRVYGVMPRLDAVGTQNHAPHARGQLARHAEYGFYRIIADGRVGQEGGGTVEVNVFECVIWNHGSLLYGETKYGYYGVTLLFPYFVSL